MDQATSLATSGYLCNNAVEIATSGYILSYSIIDVLPPDVPITDNNGLPVYDYNTMGFGGFVGGLGKGQKPRLIKITFSYKGELIEQIRAFNPNLEISVENLQIEIINNKPVITLKEFIKVNKNKPKATLKDFTKLGKNG